MEERLVSRRCFSAKSLCQSSSKELRELWGSKVGEDFYRLIHGEEIEERESERASINHSRVLSPDKRTPEHAWSNLVALLSKGAMRLREEGFYAQSLQLSLKFIQSRGLYGQGVDYWDKRARFFETQDTELLLAELGRLWKGAPPHRILRIGITLSSLVPANKHQLSLFEDPKQALLFQAIDKLNKENRKNLIVTATSVELNRPSHAPIAFGHIPERYE